MQKRRVVIGIEEQLDATPVARLVQLASDYESKIYFDFEDKCINAKSIMGMMNLQLQKGMEVDLLADGPDETEALDRIEEFLTEEEA